MQALDLENNKWVVFPSNISKLEKEVLPCSICTAFELLWEKQQQGNSCPGIIIPDTICYQGNDAPTWYFTSQQDGKILKKNSYNVTKEAIYQAFTKQADAQTRQQQPISETAKMLEQRSEQVIAYMIIEKTQANTMKEVQIEYFNKNSLCMYYLQLVIIVFRQIFIQQETERYQAWLFTKIYSTTRWISM